MNSHQHSIARFAAMALAAVFAGHSPVFAQDSEGDRLDSLRECRAIEDNAARLACYDRAVSDVIALQDEGEITVVDKEDIRETRRGLFGFSLPKLGVFGASDDDADKNLQSTITRLRRLHGDNWEIEIAEGSVWQASNTPRRFKPKVGASVELEKAAMSSYWLRVDGNLGVKARRIR